MNTRPVLVFDGDCGFCTWSVAQIRRWIDVDADIVAWQLTNLAELELTSEECTRAVQWVETDLRHWSGGRAVARMLSRSPMPWALVGNIADLPGIAWAVDRAYEVIAANRYRLPGATPACAIAAQPSAA